MNIELCGVAADTQTKPTYLHYESTCRRLSFAPSPFIATTLETWH